MMRRPSSRSFRRKHPLVSLSLRRVAIGIALVFVISILVFVGTQVLPGDAASAVLGRSTTPEAREAVREELGLNRPVTAQYSDWLTGFVQGDLGHSFATEGSVAAYIGPRLVNTVILAAVTIVIMIPLAILLGVAAAIRRDGFVDHAISVLTLGFIAIPEFVTASLLVSIFAVGLGVLPAVSLTPIGESPLATPEILVLPVATLVLAGLAYTTRMVRAGVLEVMDSSYVQMARLSGLPEHRVIRRQVLHNSLGPTVQVVALTLRWLVGGVVIVETAFAYSGLGQGLVQSVAARDIPTVQAIAMLLATFTILVNILADVGVVVLIPKLRTGRG